MVKKANQPVVDRWFRATFQSFGAANPIEIVRLDDTVMRAIYAGELSASATSSQGARSSLIVEAAVVGRWALVDRLILAGADLNHRGRDGWTLAMHLAKQKQLPLLQKVHALGADIHVCANDGTTALHCALSRWTRVPGGTHMVEDEQAQARVTTVRWLLNKGVNAGQCDETGILPLHCALTLGHFNLIEPLAKANGETLLDRSVGVFGLKAIHIAAGGMMQISTDLTCGLMPEDVALKSVRELQRLGARLQETDWRGRSAMHLSANALYPSVFEALAHAGVDPNARAHDGSTPLCSALSSPLEIEPSTVAQMVAAGANTKKLDARGRDLAQVASAMRLPHLVAVARSVDALDVMAKARSASPAVRTLTA